MKENAFKYEQEYDSGEIRAITQEKHLKERKMQKRREVRVWLHDFEKTDRWLP